MSNEILYYIIGIAGGAFVLILIAFFAIQKKMNTGDMKRIKELRAGTQENAFSADVIYQKLYMVASKILNFGLRYFYKGVSLRGNPPPFRPNIVIKVSNFTRNTFIKIDIYI